MTNEGFWGLTLRRFQLLVDRHVAAEDKLDKRAGVEWKQPEIIKEQSEEEMFQTMMQFTKKQNLLPS